MCLYCMFLNNDCDATGVMISAGYTKSPKLLSLMDSWNQMFCKREMYFIYAHSESVFPFLSQPFTHKSQEI